MIVHGNLEYVTDQFGYRVDIEDAVNIYRDFRILLDYLGVAIVTTPEKRAVVKKEKK